MAFAIEIINARSWIVLNRNSRTKRAEPPIDRLPSRKVHRKHAPAAAGPRKIPESIEHFTKVDPPPPTRLAAFRQQWLDMRSLFVG